MNEFHRGPMLTVNVGMRFGHSELTGFQLGVCCSRYALVPLSPNGRRRRRMMTIAVVTKITISVTTPHWENVGTDLGAWPVHSTVWLGIE